jgi:hypothetical protein
MASENVAQAPKTVLKYASSLEGVMDAIEEREEQLYALAATILRHLSPEDEKNIPDEHPHTAWRLAQLLEDKLSSTSHRNYVREILMCPAQ